MSFISYWQHKLKTMNNPISIQEIVDALDTASDEISSYLNKVTGQVLTLTQEELDLAEEESADDLPDWQQEAVAEAKHVLASDDWLKLPGKLEIHEWNIMEDFSQVFSSDSLREEINRSLRGKGAFRNFKATIRRLGKENAWFAFKTHALEVIARNWLVEKGLISENSAEENAQSRPLNEGYVYFALKGDDLEPDMITKALGIEPTRVMRKGNPIPKCSSWEVSTEKIVAEYIDIFAMSKQVVAFLEHKADEIGRLVQEYNLHAVLEVVLWISINDTISTPAIGFEREVIEFLYKTGAVIDIDTYRQVESDENE